MSTREKYWKYSLIAMIILLGWVICKELWPFVNGLLGAFTLFVLVRRQMIYLTEVKKIHKVAAAVLILTEIAVVFLIPVYVLGQILVNNIQYINHYIASLTEMIQQFDHMVHEKFGYDLLNFDNLSSVSRYLSMGIQIVVNQASSIFITTFVIVFLLYFMLVGYRGIEKSIYDLLPFNDENRKNLTKDIYRMVRSNAIGIPLLAIIQGIVSYIGYVIFDVPNAPVFALLTAFASIIPLVGTGLVWNPLALYLLLAGDWVAAIGVLLYGMIVVSNVDNVIRFILQKKLADTHPLITVFGVILGLSVFGFWGIIFGPLLISIFFFMISIFKREYLDKNV